MNPFEVKEIFEKFKFQDKMKIDRLNKGMVLPFVIVLSLIILTSVGFWYRKMLVQSFLSERLIVQRSSYNECESLMPILKKRLDTVSTKDLEHSNDDFLTLKTEGKAQWKISRSALTEDKVLFTFIPVDKSLETINLNLNYSRKEN